MNTSKCNKEEIINNKCINETINEEQAKFIYNYLVDKITSSNKNEIIRTKNAIFQSSTLDEQKNSNDNTISSINLGECEVLLKNKSNNPLKIIKIDIKSDDLSSTYVQYEIYDSVTGEKINLSICMDTQIKIYVPKILDNETYNNLLDSGYNIFDSNDSFYNDICTTYSSENGKDVLLSDRYQDIYIPINSMYICQDGCNFSSYNTTTQQAECNCIVNNDDINKTNIEEIIFDRMEIIRAFRNVLINSNFRVLRCYKLLFDFSKIIKNYGFIIMIVILICHLILTIIYFIKGKRKIIELINSFINLKFKIMPPLKNDKCLKSIKLKKRYKKKNQRNFNNISVGRKNPKVNNLKAETEIFNVNKNNSNKKKLNTNNSPPLKKKVNKNNNKIMNNKILKLSVKDKSSLYNSNISKIIFLTKKKEKKKNYISKSSKIKSITSEVILKDKTDIVKIPNNLVNEKYSKFLNDQELNSLEYNIAIEIDKRTYFQYYISLIKKKQLLLFTFYPNKDFNIIILKICLLLVSLSLDFTMNGFFFNDDTMHKIYKDKSKYNIIYQIPIILYSTLICAALNILLKQLSLSENDILLVSEEEGYLNAIRKSVIIVKYLKNKFIVFHLLSIIILFLCWYFISCFCAVYINTQIILINDSVISIALSMIYPFGLNLLPGLFRIPSLRDKNKKCMYQLSKIIALI